MIFFISLILRIIALRAVRPVDSYDAREYYNLSATLIPSSRFGYTKWYHRTPAYVLWLHLFRQARLPQIIFSSFAIWELSQVNLTVAVLVMLYTIPYDINYLKESVLYPVIVLIACMNDPMLKFILVLLAMLPFQSYGEVWKYNQSIKIGVMRSMFEMWKPTFGVWSNYGAIFSWLFLLPYLALMLAWFRLVDLSDVSVALTIVFSMVYAFIGYSDSRFREIPILFILLSIIH